MRYVVIFKASIQQLDAKYSLIAEQLREKALKQYNCQQFEVLTEGEHEIALSYWLTLSDIQTWQQDAEHRVAQQLGQSMWYTHFSVEICEVLRRYSNQET